MSRAALLPTPGDPVLLTLWSRYFKNVWQDEVDKLYICINNNFENNYSTYINSLFEDAKNVEIEFINSKSHPHVMGQHGNVIAHMINNIKEDYVVLVEDDSFVFHKSYINIYFDKLENNEFDLIGSRRRSCGHIIDDLSNEKYNIQPQYTYDEGPNWWPCFFFIKKTIFELTDKNFCSKHWYKGEILPIFNVTLEEDCAGDTMVWMSMQLRNLNLKIGDCPQFHGNLTDQDDYLYKRNNFNGSSYWIHIGSLSSGLGGFLSDKELPNYCNSEIEQTELERRISFWSLALDSYKEHGKNQIDELANKYEYWLNRLISNYNLSKDRIEFSKKIYMELMGWM